MGLILALGLGFRSYDLGRRGMWYDEAFSWRLSRFAFSDIVARAALDTHPPLYFVALRGWSCAFGQSPTALRALSVVSGLLAIFGMYLVCSDAFDDRRAAFDGDAPRGVGGIEPHARIGLLAAGLIAVSVFQIHWSREVRMYASGAALCAFSSWAIARAVRDDASVRWWVLYTAFGAMFLYVHHFALFSVIGQAVFVAGVLVRRASIRTGEARAGRGLVLRALLAFTTLAFVWSAQLPAFLTQHDQVRRYFWIEAPGVHDLLEAFHRMLFDPERLATAGASAGRAELLLASLLCLGPSAALLWRPRLGDWLLFCCGGVPVGLASAVSVLGTAVFHHRYLLFAHLFLAAAPARCVIRFLPSRQHAFAAAVLIANGALFSGHFWYETGFTARGGARDAARELDRVRREGEPVVVCSPEFFLPLLYHLRDPRGVRLYRDGDAGTIRSGRGAVTPGEIITPEEVASLRGGRVWVVETTAPQWGVQHPAVPAHWRIESERRFTEGYHYMGDYLLREYLIVRQETVAEALPTAPGGRGPRVSLLPLGHLDIRLPIRMLPRGRMGPIAGPDLRSEGRFPRSSPA